MQIDYRRIFELWCEQAGLTPEAAIATAQQPQFKRTKAMCDWRNHSTLARHHHLDNLQAKSAEARFHAHKFEDRLADVLASTIKANDEEYD